MIDRDPTHGSLPGGVKAAEDHGIPNVTGGSMNERGGLPKSGDSGMRKIGKKKAVKAGKKSEKAEEKAEKGKGYFGKKVSSK